MRNQTDHLSIASSDTRSLLLRAATTEFNEHGITSRTFANVAERVGLTRSSAYHYFEDNEDLLAACYDATCRFLKQCIQEALAQETSALGVLERFIELALADEAPEVAALKEVPYLKPDHRKRITKLYNEVVALIADCLGQAKEQGIVRDVDPVLTARTLLGLVNWPALGQRWNPDMSAFDGKDFADTAKDLLINGALKSGRESFSFTGKPLQPQSMLAADVFDADILMAAKKEALLAQGSWLFNQQGFDAAALGEIGQHFGVSKAVVYHNVGKRDAFIAACYRRAFDMFLRVAERMGDASTPPVAIAEALYTVTHAYLTPSLAPLAPTVGLYSLSSDVQEDLSTAAARLYMAYDTVMKKGIEQGLIREGNVEMRVMMLPGLFEWVPQWHHHNSEDERRHIANQIASLWALGIKAIE